MIVQTIKQIASPISCRKWLSEQDYASQLLAAAVVMVKLPWNKEVRVQHA